MSDIERLADLLYEMWATTGRKLGATETEMRAASRGDAETLIARGVTVGVRDPSPPEGNLREFFYRCWDYARGFGGELDGGEIQEWGEKLGLLTKVVASAPCGEGCVCAEYVGDDFPTDCYRPTFERGVRGSGVVPPEEPK